MNKFVKMTDQNHKLFTELARQVLTALQIGVKPVLSKDFQGEIPIEVKIGDGHVRGIRVAGRYLKPQDLDDEVLTQERK